jgi:hypothetical protein
LDGSHCSQEKGLPTLSYSDTTLTKAQQIQLFITGLGDPLCTDVTLQQPSSLDDVVIFTRAYEQRNASCDTVQSTPTRSYNRTTTKSTASTATTTTLGAAITATPTVAPMPATVVRLMPSEIMQQHKDGKCFHYDEFVVQGHKKQCKQLFVIEVVVDDINDEPVPNPPSRFMPSLAYNHDWAARLWSPQ